MLRNAQHPQCGVKLGVLKSNGWIRLDTVLEHDGPKKKVPKGIDSKQVHFGHRAQTAESSSQSRFNLEPMDWHGGEQKQYK